MGASNVAASRILAGRIADEIRAQGPLGFDRFMEWALYCPDLGYYEQIQHTPGRRGDYYTSVSVGPLFGELLAFQFAQWLEVMPVPQVDLVEAGAQDGQLAAVILAWLRKHQPRLTDRLRYWIVEPSARRRAWQERTLQPLGAPVRWLRGWNDPDVPAVHGVIFSNELLDAFPVRRLGWDRARGAWYEWGVDWREGWFCWTRLATPAEALAPIVPELSPELEVQLPDGMTVEVGLAAAAWWRDAAAALRLGRLLTIDYGLAGGQQLQPTRKEGTLRGYRGHRQVDDLLRDPGQQDLTAHVNWDAIRAAGEGVGLETEALRTQGRFLTRVAELAWASGSRFGQWSARRTRMLLTLVHPAHLGERFEVLVQRRQGLGSER